MLFTKERNCNRAVVLHYIFLCDNPPPSFAPCRPQGTAVGLNIPCAATAVVAAVLECFFLERRMALEAFIFLVIMHMCVRRCRCYSSASLPVVLTACLQSAACVRVPTVVLRARDWWRSKVIPGEYCIRKSCYLYYSWLRELTW